MEDPPSWELPLILALILVNGFFSLSEMALVSSRRSKLKARAESGKKAWRRVLAANEEPSRFLSTIQAGITLIGTLAGAFGGARLAGPLALHLERIPGLESSAQALSMALVVVGITFLSIVLGELVPKQLALSNPEKIAKLVVPFLEFFAVLFKPVVWLLSGSSNAILALFGVKRQSNEAVSEEEIHLALKEAEHSGIVQKNERDMLEGVFYLGDRPVEAFMTHRAEIVYLDMSASEETIRDVLKENPRIDIFPVVKDDNIDNVSGTVRARVLLEALLAGETISLKHLCQKAVFVPGTMSALKAFEIFGKNDKSLLMILDEYGGLAGTLSVSDLIEEITGDFSREDKEDEMIVRREDGSWLIGGMSNLDEVIEVLQWQALIGEHKEFHTLAGFIFDRLGRIPRTGERFEWEDHQFEIVDMDGNRIDKVIVWPPIKADPEDEPPAES